jgi:hypothetical protein
MADVSVDIETGVVKMNKFVAVQIVAHHRPEDAESQVSGR